MSKEKDDPLILDLAQRLTRVEERVSGLEKFMDSFQKRLDNLEERLSKVDNKTWWILGSVIVGILLTILTRVL